MPETEPIKMTTIDAEQELDLFRPDNPYEKGRKIMADAEPVKDLKPRNVKAPVHLIPAKPLRAISSAMLDGATKYKPWNWTEKTEDYRETYAAALLRHAQAYADATMSDYAHDSGVHHLAHAAACIMILLYHDDVDYHVPNSVKIKNGQNESEVSPDMSAETQQKFQELVDKIAAKEAIEAEPESSSPAERALKGILDPNPIRGCP